MVSGVGSSPRRQPLVRFSNRLRSFACVCCMIIGVKGLTCGLSGNIIPYNQRIVKIYLGSHRSQKEAGACFVRRYKNRTAYAGGAGLSACNTMIFI